MLKFLASPIVVQFFILSAAFSIAAVLTGLICMKSDEQIREDIREDGF